MTHTPGPYEIRKAPKQVDGAYDFAIVAQGKLIAECFGRSSETDFHDSEANARLMAEAPEMLRLLKIAISEDTGEGFDTLIAEVIAKAEGRS